MKWNLGNQRKSGLVIGQAASRFLSKEVVVWRYCCARNFLKFLPSLNISHLDKISKLIMMYL